MDEVNDVILKPFAIVEFYDGLEVIRREWGIFENDIMVASYFPPIKSRKDLTVFLKGNYQEINKDTWIDDDGEPYKIKKFCNYATNLENAVKKLELNILMSDVDSDDIQNLEKAKKSRHSRYVTEKCQKQPLKSKEVFISSKETIPECSEILDYAEDEMAKELNTDKVDNFHSQSEEEERQMTKKADIEEIGSESEDDQVNGLEMMEKKRTDSEKNAQNQDDDNRTYSFVKKSTKMMLAKINRIEMNMKSNRGNEQENNIIQRFSFLNPDDDLKMFPAKNLAEVHKINDKLLSKSFFMKVAKALSDLGPSNTQSMTVSNMLCHLLTYETGQAFTYKGKSNRKPAFCNLKFNTLVVYAMGEINKNVQPKDTRDNIAKWLTQCKFSANREKVAKEKQRKSTEEALLRFTED